MRLTKKITQEDFDKLPQLDRIEFRQKRDFLINNYPQIGAFYFLNYLIIFLFGILIMALTSYNISIDLFIKIFYLIPIIVKIGGLIFIFLLLLQILVRLKYTKDMNKLYEDYFEHKIEIRNKNGKKTISKNKD